MGADFLKTVENHVMAVELDQGVNRCLYFGEPNSSNRHFRLTTWKGHLTISGDMGTFVFSRTPDMFTFFRNDTGTINPSYWGEKLQAISTFGGYKKFDWPIFVSKLEEMLVEQHSSLYPANEVKEALQARLRWVDQDEYGMVELMRNWDPDEDFLEIDPSDLPDFEAYSYQYLWCIRAIVWGIRQYDKLKGLNGEES